MLKILIHPMIIVEIAVLTRSSTSVNHDWERVDIDFFKIDIENILIIISKNQNNF